MTPVTTALASFGMSGLVFHGPLLSTNKGFHLSTVLERKKNESIKYHPEAKIVRTFKEICDNDQIELVVINTPDQTHYDLTKLALKHGKHVVVEKPFTLQHEQALELIDLAKLNGLVLSVFQNRRWDGDFMTVQQVIANDLLGRLVSFESHFDRYRNYIQENTWKEDASTGTGTLYNLGSHMIDQALVLFGKPDWVFADVRNMRTASKIDDSFDIWMAYPDVKVKVCGSYLVREPGPRYTLHGTEGSFLKWGIDPQEEALKAGKLPGLPEWGEEPEEEWGLLHTRIEGKDYRGRYHTVPGDYTQFYDNIYSAIRHKEPLAVKPEESALGIKIIEACFESAQRKKVVKV